MSFGWSPSDIVSLARLAYEVYNFCQTAPAELQGLLDRLERIGRKLELFSTILEKSGLGEWKKAPALNQHLLDAQAYLKPLQVVTRSGTSAPSKVKGLIRVALNQDKLRRIEKSLDVDEACIDEMKMDLVLVSSLRNLQNGSDYDALRLFEPRQILGNSQRAANSNGEISPILVNPTRISALLEADQQSIISVTVSNASRALEMAMELRSRRNSITGPMPVRERQRVSRHEQLANEFIADVVSLAEKTKLYSQEADLTTSLDKLTEMTEKAKALPLVLPLPESVQRPEQPPIQTPGFLAVQQDSLGREVFGQLSSTSDNASMRLWALDNSRSQSGSSHVSEVGHQTPSTSYSDQAPSIQLPLRTRSKDQDEILPVEGNLAPDAIISSEIELSPKRSIDLHGRSKFSLTRDPRASLDCIFELQQSEGSTVMQIVSNHSPRHNPDAAFASGALPPHLEPSPRTRPLPGGRITDPSLRALQHCFEAHSRPIPHLIHPDVEGPEEEPNAPYKITFTERQYISSVESSEPPRWTTSLMYIFFEKQDQLTLCEKIFGKTLVMTAGSNKITHGGQEISHISTVTLWFNDVSETLSITFSPNLANNKSRTVAKDIELNVHGLWDLKKKALRNPNAIAVAVESLATATQLNALERPPTAQSGIGSFFGRAHAATITTVAGNASATAVGRKKCVIEFTKLADRTAFAAHFS